MIQLFIKYFPYILLLYFLIRSLREPIYLLGVPFLIFFRYCIFFDSVKLFSTPAGAGADLLLFFWLLFFWFIFSNRSLIQSEYRRTDYYTYKGVNWLDIFIIALIVMTIVNLIIVLGSYFNDKDVVKEFFTLLSLPLGFFIIKNIVRYVNPLKLVDFLYSVVFVNSIASLLYFIHQGLHIPLYSFPDEEQELFQGEVITRTFWFMPILWFFSIAYLIIFRKRKFIASNILLIVNFLGISISYTRAFLLISFAVILLYFILNGYKSKNFFSIFKNLIGIALVAGILFFALSRFLPANINYFIGRFKELKQEPDGEESNTLVYRFAMTGEVIDKIDDNKKFIGMGPVTEKQLPWVEDMRATTADMVWTGVIFRWGYIGLILFALLYSISIVKAFILFANSQGILSQLGLLFFLTIISQVIESFTSWTFFNPSHFAMGLWYFGMLSALTGFDKKADFSFENK